MQKSKIDWGVGQLWTWNPVTGCKRGCSYCYARRIHERFYKTPFSDIEFHAERLNDPGLKAKEPRTVFVGSMSDIEYWDEHHLRAILEMCKRSPQHTFMFLSKSPVSYIGVLTPLDWPENCMQGLTLTRFDDFAMQGRVNNWIRNWKPKFISFEPLLGPMNAGFGAQNIKIIVGAMTGPGAIKPKAEWVQSIKDNVPADKIFWKPSMEPYL